MDNSAASLRLWNFLLTEEDRLRRRRYRGQAARGNDEGPGHRAGHGLRPDNLVAFYPDGAWWLPCLMEDGTHLLAIADSLGIDESFCPVRAMLGAFVGGQPLPHPGLADVQRRGRSATIFRRSPSGWLARGFRSCGGRFRTAGSRSRRSSGRASGQPVAGRRRETAVPGAGRASGLGKGGTRPRPAGLRVVCPAAAWRPAARRGHRAGQPGPPPVGRIAGTLLHGRSLPAAGPGTTDCRDAGNSFLFRSK